MNSEYKQSAIGKDFLQTKNSFNYPKDNYIIQGSGSYYQLSEREFFKARKDDDGAPTEIRDPNTTYEWAKQKPETTFDKMAKAHFKEQDRRKYEEERNKNINMRGTASPISIIPDAPLPPSTNPLTKQLQNVKLKDGFIEKGNDILAQINQAQNRLNNIDTATYYDAPDDIFYDVLDKPTKPKITFDIMIENNNKALQDINDVEKEIKNQSNKGKAKLEPPNYDFASQQLLSQDVSPNQLYIQAGPSSSPIANRTRSRRPL
jgi:hypothetical protein